MRAFALPSAGVRYARMRGWRYAAAASYAGAVPSRQTTERRKAEGRTIGEAMKRRRMMLEVRREAAEFCKGLSRNADPATVVQVVLDNIYTAYEYATQQVMELTEDEYWFEALGGKIPNHWIREQERLGMQLVHVAAKASAMGLAEREIHLQEAQAALFASVLDAALKEAGLTIDQRHGIHVGVSRRLDDIEGTAKEIAA
jgi:hypothetical protein